MRSLLHSLSAATLVAVSTGCGSELNGVPGPDDGPDQTPVFDDVSASNLPTGALTGLSMDARAADLDRDGDMDIVVANEFGRNILLLNDGTGTFTNASDRFPASSRDSEDVGIADFDRDGNLDVLIVSEDDQVNELYLGDGEGGFVDAGDRIPVTGTSNAVLVAEVNGDDAPDILIGNNGQNVILINDGTGEFVDESGERLPAINDVTQDLELGDVDGDGDLDLLVGNEGPNRLLINDGTGRFSDESDARIPLRDGPEETREADFGDIDGDGDLDILFANVAAFVAGADPGNRVLVNDGSGVFTDGTFTRLPANSNRSFDGDFFDLDSDGDLDIVTSNTNQLGGSAPDSPYVVYLNDGSGRFEVGTDSIFPPGTLGKGFDVEAVDVDGDGRLDLYMASRGSADRLLIRRAP